MQEKSKSKKSTSKFKRVLLKISGDGFCKKDQHGFNIQEINNFASEVVKGYKMGVEIAIVVGGGNIVRGHELEKQGLTMPTGDYMGMLATMINALALQNILEQMNVKSRVLNAFTAETVAEQFIRRKAINYLTQGNIIILAAGTGNPHFTTDTAAALRAAEIKADILFKATKVDGVFDSDPMKFKNAKKYSKLTYMEILNQNLRIMDPTAITMCMEHKLPILVFNMKKKGNIKKVLSGHSKIGTLISQSK